MSTKKSVFGKFVSKHWFTYWLICVAIVFIGLVAVLFGGDFGWPLIGFPAFFLGVGYLFKKKYEKLEV